jgi:FtsH-binding integral membrane protein
MVDSKEQFSDLLSASRYLEDLPLHSLAAALRQRADTDTDRVELFQAKLPATAIPTYGSLILLVCQFYLLGHLLELRRRLSTDLTEPWPSGYLGLYPDRLMSGFAIASLSAFPPIPLLMALLQNKGALRLVGVAVFVISAIVGVVSAYTLSSTNKLRPLHGSGPRPED